MNLRRLSLSEIDESTLQRLVENKVSEHKRLEFKRELPEGTDGDKKDFCKEVSALANTAGGHLIYGIAEKAGAAENIDPIETEDPDGVKLRLEGMMEDGIRPRIPGARIHPLELSAREFAFIIRVPQSWVSPHMVTMRGHDRFHGRNSAGKYRLDVDELRTSFVESEAVSSEIRDFRTDRVGKVLSGEIPVPLEEPGALLLHIVPYESIAKRSPKDLSPIAEDPTKLPPLPRHTGWSNRFNLDGFMTYDRPGQRGSQGYTQAFREGMIEGVEGGVKFERDGTEYLSTSVQGEILDRLPSYLDALRKMGCEPPIAILVTLTGMKDVVLEPRGHPSLSRRGDRTFDRDVLSLPEVVLDSLESVEPAHTLRPIFTALWRAAGWPRCPSYNQNGEWQG